MAATSRRYSRPSPPSSSSTAFAHSSSGFASRSSNLFTTTQCHHQQHHYQRSTSPPRVNLCGTGSATTRSASSVRFSLDRPISPNRSITSSVSRAPHQVVRKPSKKTCMCSPTTHPGSFRCSLHKNFNNNNSNSVNYPSPSTRLNARRSAMTNSLVRICGVEGDLVKRALSSLIRPSSHQQKRRAAFQPRPSRLSVMSKAEGLL
ncbi:uncharacterized protein LOC8286597 [Ricinus communis]|uniref:Serine-rich protein n=1 Tax=Ricinus communis TaxID=3988 RepID=B9SZN0_RICCO|nr:uncharacterized protein LOC8286597 [Ricinus communis]EEF30936.1 conserved hypothetical protein [Ricinus communis]|eukprot:XP_002531449.1 uncharacterized protein LOC8286597 [Ricinus communis]